MDLSAYPTVGDFIRYGVGRSVYIHTSQQFLEHFKLRPQRDAVVRAERAVLLGEERPN